MPRTLSFLLAAVALIAVTACHSTPSGSDGFRTVAIGYETGLVDGPLRIARNEREWGDLWREHTSTQVPAPPAPMIDFSKELVVCVLAGQKPTAGYGIEVVDADFDGKAMVLGVRETKPAADAIVPQVVTRPYHMIATPMTNASFRIDWR
jgi:hypothetical protein